MKEIERYFPKSFLSRYGETAEIAWKSAVDAHIDISRQISTIDDEQQQVAIVGDWQPRHVLDHINKSNRFFGDCLVMAHQGQPLDMAPGMP